MEREKVEMDSRLKDLEKLITEMTKENSDLKAENKVLHKLYKETQRTESHLDEESEPSIVNDNVNHEKDGGEKEKSNQKSRIVRQEKGNEKREKEQAKFSCEQCEYKTNNKNMLRRHQTTSTNHVMLDVAPVNEFLKCGTCDTFFKEEAMRKKHVEEGHKPDPSLQCTLCDFVAVNKDILQIHMRIAMGHKIFLNGNCTRGRFCKYLHPMNIDNRNNKDSTLNINRNLRGNDNRPRSFEMFRRSHRNVMNVQNYQNRKDIYSNTRYNTPQTSSQNRQCKFWDNCYNFPDCGFSHYEVCRYQSNCRKGPNCRFVHLQNSTFLDFLPRNWRNQ